MIKYKNLFIETLYCSINIDSNKTISKSKQNQLFKIIYLNKNKANYIKFL